MKARDYAYSARPIKALLQCKIVRAATLTRRGAPAKSPATMGA
jgi:hypothetical protein